MKSDRMVIIGAGQAGLASAFHAKRAGIEPIILEAGNSAAGSWSAYYDSLRLFSPARYSSLPGMPFPGDPDRYPTRDEVVGYLAEYAAWLSADIRFTARASSVTHESGQFTVATTGGETFTAATLVAATGGFGNPYRPNLPGLSGFEGAVLHSRDYRTPQQFAGSRVVVVGAGNSAVQIAVELADIARVTLATREPIRWIRQRPLGLDVHWWFRHTGFDAAPLGTRLAKLGVTVLDAGAYRAALRESKPDRRPMFTRLDGHDVVWTDGGREHVDAVILATGFRPDFAYLGGVGALSEAGSPMHRRGVSTTVAGLGYAGLEFQRTFSSATLRGVGADARQVVRRLARL